MKSGIYKIQSKSGKIYIGSAIDINKRWNLHKNSMVKNKHHNIHIQRSFNKHGIDYFSFSVLEYCEKEKLIEREQYYIDMMKPEFNICKTAGSTLGIKLGAMSDEQKNKISKSHIGKKLSQEAKLKISNAHKGKKHTEEFKNYISEINK